MRIEIVTTDLAHASRGNQVTAFRWQRLLQQLGHEVHVVAEYSSNSRPDVLISIHARKSHGSLVRFKNEFPSRPALVCLSGTDLQVDLLPEKKTGTEQQKENHRRAAESCQLADGLILLEPYSLHRLNEENRAKAVVILQSAQAIVAGEPPSDCLLISQLAHLRPIKAPFQIVEAVLKLPEESRIQVVHAGQAMDETQRAMANAYQRRCPRYKWVGGLKHESAIGLLTNSHATVLSSLAEGAPSVISEAIINGVPFIGSRIDATLGLLGEDYPALFEVGSAEQLAELLSRFEGDDSFRLELSRWTRELAPKFSEQQEQASWRQLLDSL